MTEWRVIDHDNDGNTVSAESRQDAEQKQQFALNHGSDNVEIVPPGATDGGEHPEVIDAEPVDVERDTHAEQLPDRSVADDPLNWVPGSFVDEIDGTQAINRKGFEVLAHFYDVDVHCDVEVPPEDTDVEYCRAKAVATTADGRECEAYGSAHVDRDDDKTLLLEMADTRARKRALSIATGVGAVAVEELKAEATEGKL